MIGLSGLITPSLDEMVTVAEEMQREGMTMPLLIGGATTSPAHTAVKIDPVIKTAPVLHVTDASRAVGVVSALLSAGEKQGLVEQTRARYLRMRESRQGGPPKPRHAIEQARALAFRPDAPTPPPPSFTGTRVFEAFDLSVLARYVDWTPYFASWNLAGRYPQILEDKIVGAAARDLWRDTETMMVGFWPLARATSLS